MKKILISALVIMICVGCSSSEELKKKDEEKKISIVDNDKTATKENPEEKKDEQKVDESKKEEQKSQNIDDAFQDKKKETESTKKEETGTTSKNPDVSQPQDPVKPTPPPPPPPAPEAPSNQKAKADQVFAQINAYREANGKAPFAYSAEIYATAESHALAMANREALWHSGIHVENITNYDDPFTAWKNSPGHNEVLLCNNTEGAVGIYYYNGYYYSVFQCRW